MDWWSAPGRHVTSGRNGSFDVEDSECVVPDQLATLPLGYTRGHRFRRLLRAGPAGSAVRIVSCEEQVVYTNQLTLFDDLRVLRIGEEDLASEKVDRAHGQHVSVRGLSAPYPLQTVRVERNPVGTLFGHTQPQSVK